MMQTNIELEVSPQLTVSLVGACLYASPLLLCRYLWCHIGFRAPVSHLGLLQRRVCALPVDHAERDALGLRGKRPGDGGTGTAHGDGEAAVTAGLDEKLSGVVPKP